MQENETFITIKDHKEWFPNHMSCRLLNPSKANIGKISKVLLAKINLSILSSPKINQWKNKSSVIIWCDNITSKQTLSFLCFDVEISIHLSPVIYLKNQLNLQDSSSRFLLMTYRLSCRLKRFFLKVQYPRSKRVVMKNSTFQ